MGFKTSELAKLDQRDGYSTLTLCGLGLSNGQSARSAANYHHFDPWPFALAAHIGGKNSYFGRIADLSIEMSESLNDNFIVLFFTNIFMVLVTDLTIGLWQESKNSEK